MDIKEFNILLKLLGQEDYTSTPSRIKPNSGTTTPQTRNLCSQLCNRNFVELTEKIEMLGITSTGKTLIKQKNCPEALTKKEWKLLNRFAKKGTLKPSETNVGSMKAAERDEIITKAIERGFLEVKKSEIDQVILTREGQEFLATTNTFPSHGNVYITSFQHYSIFLQKYWQKNQVNSSDLESRKNLPKPTDEDILQTIIDLDKELNTDNYLPIFHLRNKLQPPLTRGQLDQSLYRLQKQDKLSMSSLVDSSKYSLEEYKAGIPQLDCGPLFYLIVN